MGWFLGIKRVRLAKVACLCYNSLGFYKNKQKANGLEDVMKRFWKDLKSHYRYAIYSAKSELKSEVANSYLNWIWWVLEPFCFMLIYAFIFGVVFNASEQYFPVFIFLGITAWDFSTDV